MPVVYSNFTNCLWHTCNGLCCPKWTQYSLDLGCQVVIVVAYVALGVDGIVESSFFLGVSVDDVAIIFADDVVWK
eukprot:3340657-Amphidinium_carterae.1